LINFKKHFSEKFEKDLIFLSDFGNMTGEFVIIQNCVKWSLISDMILQLTLCSSGQFVKMLSIKVAECPYIYELVCLWSVRNDSYVVRVENCDNNGMSQIWGGQVWSPQGYISIGIFILSFVDIW